MSKYIEISRKQFPHGTPISLNTVTDDPMHSGMYMTFQVDYDSYIVEDEYEDERYATTKIHGVEMIVSRLQTNEEAEKEQQDSRERQEYYRLKSKFEPHVEFSYPPTSPIPTKGYAPLTSPLWNIGATVSHGR